MVDQANEPAATVASKVAAVRRRIPNDISPSVATTNPIPRMAGRESVR